ncbi:tyrosine kinase receptor Cad96Ca-like isoform X3 [Apostichopus japonicus]|uniref:tyrosine kinase receptor Cad96Ca-like isoform X3 n=1 Tax=Stichopus japonicus TaxID=307972 RepID=UPI003AB1E398
MYYSTFDKDQTSKIDSSNDLLLILGCFLGSFSIAICIMFACLKAIMKRQTYLLSLLREHDVPGETDVQIHTLSRSMPHENRASVKSNIGCYTTRIISDEDEGEEISSQDRSSRCRRLPEIPNDEDESGEYAYYSDSKEIYSKTQMFKLQDVCVLTKLNFGDLYKRWTGTLTHKDNLNKCVVITTESGKNETNKRLHWNAFVRRLLELPANSKNLVGTEGIYIDGDQIYLLQEHLVCQTLQTLMADGCFETNWSSSMARNFILDVLGGITLLQSYGLLHPGLSRSKILVTSSRNCKLYDFCLPDDASLIVRSIKSKVKCTQNQLPLESWQRNEYTKESDIWSAAVVIWEIMSNGTSFPGRDEAISDWSYRANLSDCSTTNCELRDELLRRCWQTDVSKRPSILELRKCYEQISSQSELESSYMTMS